MLHSVISAYTWCSEHLYVSYSAIHIFQKLFMVNEKTSQHADRFKSIWKVRFHYIRVLHKSNACVFFPVKIRVHNLLIFINFGNCKHYFVFIYIYFMTCHCISNIWRSWLSTCFKAALLYRRIPEDVFMTACLALLHHCQNFANYILCLLLIHRA